jgi:hypothetical protein
MAFEESKPMPLPWKHPGTFSARGKRRAQTEPVLTIDEGAPVMQFFPLAESGDDMVAACRMRWVRTASFEVLCPVFPERRRKNRKCRRSGHKDVIRPHALPGVRNHAGQFLYGTFRVAFAVHVGVSGGHRSRERPPRTGGLRPQGSVLAVGWNGPPGSSPRTWGTVRVRARP